MDIPKPLGIKEYIRWLKEYRRVEITYRVQNRYEAAAARMKRDFETSRFWKQLVENLQEYNDQYNIETGYQLLHDPEKPPQLDIKKWDPFLDKTYRKNIVQNVNWPGPPEDGWILPDNWYSRIDDILRTIIVVKYLDGARFLVNKMRSLCEQSNRCFQCAWEAKEEGYYAVHTYIEECFEIPRIDWDTERVTAKVEIQITTQIQEVIRKLLHNYYEKKRSMVSPTAELIWQGDYESDEFIANYLGHILHYVEGMIIEIRDRERSYDTV